ncbi:ectonucleoside triphosphate diphosphohydrolase I [Legionella hackeliae]|uniref:Ectonucleoside triphosphate diphosphohydrolase I n=2 Tax=Legionella hackeliae TaxID=449 RepID=A0A0A8UNM8_LEGHA|nr:ectonucleoside triphosphate diphosphohydrolase I [Legionella hackeliae]CEK10368.1 Ectonucleoside triphosphate diphosphohydrolase I [Legionella hackeliae]STX47104.1 ectonucleoside triphosphate diphosphohydrolase I [Legionella hackeliae]
MRPTFTVKLSCMRIVALWVSLFAICFTANVFAAEYNCQQHQCVAVVDAGSTGSRVHIYSYDLDSTQSPININEVWSKRIKPGFATIEPNSPTIDAYLTTLLSGAPENNLPIYFYSTAGMRLLPKPKQQQLYGLLQQWFANQSSWQLKNAKTITGTEEGIFGWLAVNYQRGSLEATDQDLSGVMDMGGASVQIIFPVEKTDGINSQDLQQIDLYGRHLTIFVHSFLGLGQTEVTHQFLDESVCFANNYELPTGQPASGDAYSCESDVASLMNSVHRVNHVVQPVMTANPVNNWFVIGGLAELTRSKPFQLENQFSSQDLLEQANTQVCHQDWQILVNQYPNNDYLYGYCLFPAYYYALIVDGYGLQPQQEINLMAANQNSDWTLGVVLTQKPAQAS